MGNVEALGTCCASRGNEGIGSNDGKTMCTLNGVEALPNGACCLQVGVGPDQPLALTSPALLEMIRTDDRLVEYRKLCGDLYTFDVGMEPDFEQVLKEHTPGFMKKGIDLYLTNAHGDFGRWMIFVDRKVNPKWEPSDASKSRKGKSMVKKLFRGTDAYELVETETKAPGEVVVCDHGTANFSGFWVETNLEGDAAGFMKERGINSAAVWALGLINYGCGFVQQEIVHEGNRLRMTFHRGRMGSFVNDLTIDGKRRKNRSPVNGAPANSSQSWCDDGAAVLFREFDDEGKELSTSRRYLRTADQMVCEVRNTGGKIAMMRVAERREKPAGLEWVELQPPDAAPNGTTNGGAEDVGHM